MGHSTRRGNAVELVGEHAGGTLAAAYVGRARAEYCRVRALCAAGAKFEHSPAVGRAHYAVGLRGDEALVVDGQQQEGLQQLGLYGGGAHGYDRLAGEHRRSLRYCPDVSRELEAAEIVEEALVEDAARAQILYVLFIKVQVLDIIHRLLEPGGYGEAALVGHCAVKEVKIGYGVLHAADEIPIAHCELVEIAEHGVVVAVFLHLRIPSSE